LAQKQAVVEVAVLRRRLVLITLVVALASSAACKGCGDKEPAKVDVAPSAETMAQQQARREITAENADDTAAALAAKIEVELAAERAAVPTIGDGGAPAATVDAGAAQP
jgi:hypothetical protein